MDYQVFLEGELPGSLQRDQAVAQFQNYPGTKRLYSAANKLLT